MNSEILKINNLTKNYTEFSLKNINISMPTGYIMGFIGPNGSGKSTLIKCIMNFIEFDSGSVEILGVDNKKHFTQIKNQVGYVGEEHYFYEKMTVDYMAKFIGSFYKTWDNAYYNKLLDKIKLDKTKKIFELSKGTRAKLAFVLAMAHRPKILILDEPTSNLDPIIRTEVLELFLEFIQDENCSIFFSSHIVSDIEKVSDYITIINEGEIILSQEKTKILDDWKIAKFDNSCNDEIIKQNMIAFKEGSFGKSALVNNIEKFSNDFKNKFPGQTLKVENIDIDTLLYNLIKNNINLKDENYV